MGCSESPFVIASPLFNEGTESRTKRHSEAAFGEQIIS